MSYSNTVCSVIADLGNDALNAEQELIRDEEGNFRAVTNDLNIVNWTIKRSETLLEQTRVHVRCGSLLGAAMLSHQSCLIIIISKVHQDYQF